MFVFPRIGQRRVSEVTGPMVHDVLSEIWMTKPETARRERQRIGVVLDWAFSKGYRESEISMKSVTRGLPRQPKNSQHCAAMPYSEVSAFLTRLREKETMGRLALEFAIATAARSGEVRGAIWDEIDLENRLWTIPPDRIRPAVSMLFRSPTMPVGSSSAAGNCAATVLTSYSMAPSTACPCPT